MDLIPTLSAAGGPRSTAVAVDGRSLTWEELAGAAGAVAARVMGVDRVAVEATPTLETVVAVVGALAAGATVVPVPPDAGPMEREHIMRDSGAVALPVGVDVSARSELPRADLPADRTAMILYTSGTTGLPKGVMLSAQAIATDLDLLAAAWEWTPEDVLAHGLPLFHVHGLILGVLGSLRVGSSLVHTGRPTPEAYAAAGGSLLFGVPTVWSRIAAEPSCASALRGARLLVSGSAGLPVPVFERLTSLCGHGPIERYGMTETLITVSGLASGERRPGWVGTALPRVATRLVGDDGAPVPFDGESVGSLEVSAPTVMSGYVNLPEETAGLFTPDGWVRTGDVACVDGEGWHRIVGRESTDLIKSGGFRIGAGEVEAALLAHPSVSEAAVVGEPDDDLGQVVVAYVVGEGVDEAELVTFVAEKLSVHKRPRRVIAVDSLPRNAMGKVQKKLLVRG
ncbi:MAG TPA: acyl-CoA synthetase [Acidimicrobiales bacterium]|nr:acyl-CoA synthetase [Acidimicrobiales bacterium]